MSAGDESNTDRDRRVDEAIAWYYRQAEGGSVPEPEAFLTRFPDVRDDLVSFLADKAAFERAAGPADPDATVTVAADDSRPPTPAAPLGTVRYFGDYELLEEIARGGMGVVYKARQVSLNRVVALKMILAGQLASAADQARFRQEAEAAANLDHPNILPIYEVGEHQAQQYFSMKLVEGGSLADKLRRSPRTGVRGLSELLVKVARAVHYAHQRGLLHRDLKPANILLDPDGTPYVTDFGLAKKVEDQSGLTQSGALVGTPSYMAPEQARAEKQLSTGVDVYSLGAILYEVLAGRPPFRGDTVYDTVRQVLERDPEDPRKLNPRADRDLSVIALKCLAKEPVKRYESAAALADDLGRWQRGEPIAARPAGPRERLSKWVRRHPVPAAFTALTLLLLAAGVSAITVMYFRAEGYRQDAERERDQARDRLARQYAEKAAALADQGNPLGGLPWLVEALKVSEGRPQAELHRVHLHALLHTAPGLVHYSPTATCATLHPDGLRVAIGEKDGVVLYPLGEDRPLTPILKLSGAPSHVVFSPDGKRVLVAGGVGGAGLGPWQPTPARVFDVDTGNPVGPEATLGRAKEGATAVRFSEDGAVVVALWQGHVNRHVVNTEVFLYDAATLAPVGKPFVWGHPEGLDYVRVDFRNLRALTPCRNVAPNELDFAGQVQMWELRTGRALFDPIPLRQAMPVGPRSPDGSRFVLMDGDRTVRLHDATTGKPTGPTFPHPAAVLQVAVRPDGLALATLAKDGSIRVWDVPTGKATELVTAVFRLEEWSDLAYSPDGQMLYLSGPELVAVWDARTGGSPVLEIPHKLASQGLVFSPDGVHVLTADYEGVHIWERKGRRAIPYLPHGTAVSAAYGPDGRYLLTTGNGMRVWDLSAARPPAEPYFPPQTVPVQDVTIGPAADQVAVLDADGTARVSDARTGEPITPAHRLPGDWREVGLSPDGKFLYTLGWAEGRAGGPSAAEAAGRMCGGHGHYVWQGPRDVGVWDPATGRPVIPPLAHRTIGQVVFHPDGKTLLVAGRYVDYTRSKKLEDPSEDFTELSRWDLTTGEPTRPVLRLPGVYHPLGFTPDGRKLLEIVRSAHNEKLADAAYAVLWDAETLTAEGWLYGPQSGWVVHAALSPDATRLLTVSADGDADVWDVESGARAAGPFRHTSPRVGHRPALSMAAFSPDGRRVATGTGVDYSGQGEARVWDAATGKPVTPVLRHHAWVRYVGFSPDGRLLVTEAAGKDGWEVRVWEADTGMPVTPPFAVPVQTMGVTNTQVRDLSDRPRFAPDGRRLLVPSAGSLSVIDLVPEARSAADLEPLARILAGHEVDPAGGFQPLSEASATEAAERWRKLRPAGRAAQTPEAARDYRQRSARLAVETEAWETAHRLLGECLRDTPDAAWLWSERANVSEKRGRWADARADLDEVVRRADGPSARRRRGEAFARLARFPDAAADLSAAADRSGQAEDAIPEALARWAAGDRAGYRRAAGRLAGRAGELTRDTNHLVRAALACGLDPDGPDRLRPFVPVLESFRRVETFNAEVALALALAEVRTGEAGKAIERMKEYDAAKPEHNRQLAVRALAHSKAGKGAPARDFLKQWDEWFAGVAPTLDWQERTILAALRKELDSP